MGIPAGLSRHHVSFHGAVPRDHVLDDTGQHVADVRLAVGGWRSVIKCVGRTALSLFHTFLENVMVLPELRSLFFPFHEVQIR